MRPTWELLTLPAGGADPAALRRLARGHRQASQAPHASRSYCGPVGLLAWSERPVGVDLERMGSADRSLGESICTPGELRRYAERLDDPAFVTSLWSSKEALAKALGDAVDYDPRRLESPLGWPGGTAGPWRGEGFAPIPDHVAWLVWSIAPAPRAHRAAWAGGPAGGYG
ncbi:MAG TPA: 4'-phosphopantetheinyl transferase superfamily protein [Solirubrobacteraceae bacterium]|nr:4'-phosphopantetheinyl transferase superfamily protein [Solirubrobacteraceae bacterium]